jgi:hypothetical protein
MRGRNERHSGSASRSVRATAAASPTADEIESMAAAPSYGIEIGLPGN